MLRRVLHVVTVHHRTSRWIPIQRRYLERFAGMPYRVWAVVEDVPMAERVGFDFVEEYEGDHSERLNYLAAQVLASGTSDDWLLFLDSDALPLTSLPSVMDTVHTIGAIRRDENVGDIQPHPSFALTKLGFWRDIGGDWSDWLPWRRLNSVDEHPLWFGVYGDERCGPVAYHHGAGSRARDADAATDPPRWWEARASRRDVYDTLVGELGSAPWDRFLGTLDRLLADDAWVREAERSSESVMASIERDDRFWQRFIPRA
jgi:hypothetical protein